MSDRSWRLFEMDEKKGRYYVNAKENEQYMVTLRSCDGCVESRFTGRLVKADPDSHVARWRVGTGFVTTEGHVRITPFDKWVYDIDDLGKILNNIIVSAAGVMYVLNSHLRGSDNEEALAYMALDESMATWRSYWDNESGYQQDGMEPHSGITSGEGHSLDESGREDMGTGL